MEAARALNRLGWAVDFIPVDEYGTIDLDAYEQAFRDDTRLASVMFANNVVGTIQPVAELARIVRAGEDRYGAEDVIRYLRGAAA